MMTQAVDYRYYFLFGIMHQNILLVLRVEVIETIIEEDRLEVVNTIKK